MQITLKAARINCGITQEVAANLIGVSKNTVSNWEKNRSYPDARAIKRIESVYSIKYDELIFLPSYDALSIKKKDSINEKKEISPS